VSPVEWIVPAAVGIALLAGLAWLVAWVVAQLD
jgi:hypothetical protein